jgi:hypothetical protein
LTRARILADYTIQHIAELVAHGSEDRPCIRRNSLGFGYAEVGISHVPSCRDSLPNLRRRRRKTMAPFAWNIRKLHSYSVRFVAPENAHLVRNLVRIVWRF